jgi:hypothetical protein
MRRKFKNRNMQEMYDICRRLAGDLNSEFFINGKPRRGAAHRSAYWTGREGKPNKLWPRNSLSYACWAAGKDDGSGMHISYPEGPIS